MKIEEIPVEVTVILGKVNLKLKELHLGDIIILNQKINEPVEVRLGSGKKISGFPCICRNKKGVKIQKV